MDFSNLLNQYMNELNCSSNSLAKESNLSASTISRYKNGTRVPENPSKELDNLIHGLANLYKKNNKDKNEKIIKEAFDKIIKPYDFDKMINNFNKLIKELNINISDFSKMLGFDPSYISKIRNKERKPSNPNIIIDAISKYIIKKYDNNQSKNKISKLVKCSIDDLSDEVKFKKILNTWLSSKYEEFKTDNNINEFLIKIDDFDLNEYIKAINFDKIKVPELPFKIPKSKNYYGLEEMKNGELDFLKSTILDKNSKEVFMCSDMQMDDLAQDLDFGKKWMLGIAMMLKKGIHLNFIHNIDRPLNEMMLGLESWIPIYMTGQVSPFYFSNLNDNIYSHLNYVANNVILTGECIKGYHSKGKYYLTNNKKEVEYYKEKAKLLLKKATPLMKIYTVNEKEEFNTFFNNLKINSNLKIINSSLPIYTIKEDLLLKILNNNNIPKEDINKILDYVNKIKLDVKKIVNNNKIHEVISMISKKDFNSYPVTIDLSRLFYKNNIYYTYEEYLKHLESTKEYFNKNNYILEICNNLSFRNIKITINTDNCVIISKNNNPKIHFIIKHPKLCSAIENFVAPINENKE